MLALANPFCSWKEVPACATNLCVQEQRPYLHVLQYERGIGSLDLKVPGLAVAVDAAGPAPQALPDNVDVCRDRQLPCPRNVDNVVLQHHGGADTRHAVGCTFFLHPGKRLGKIVIGCDVPHASAIGVLTCSYGHVMLSWFVRACTITHLLSRRPWR